MNAIHLQSLCTAERTPATTHGVIRGG